MKKPDEIKKGLECCAVDACFGERENCPYTADPTLCVGVMCEDALTYIQQLEALVPRWIPVEERLPEPDVFVLVGYKRYDLVFEGCYIEDEKFWCDREYSYIAPPSHWMSLPEPPEEVRE